MMVQTPSDVSPSVIQRLHPFVKMGAGAGSTALALLLTDPRSLGLLLLLFLIALGTARAAVRLRQALSILLLMGSVAGLNFWASGDPDQALAYSLRLAVFIVAMPAMALATAPQEMARALSRLPLPPGPARRGASPAGPEPGPGVSAPERGTSDLHRPGGG